MIIYLLKFSGLLLLAAIGYVLFLKRIKHYSFSRKYLLSSIILSLFLPTIPSFASSSLEVFSVTLPELTIIAYGDLAHNTTNDSTINWPYLIGLSYLAISVLLLFRLLYSIWSLDKIIKTSTLETIANENCHISDTVKNPFSFLNHIVLPDTTSYSPQELQAIILHEKLHVQYQHSIEKIILEVFKCLFWWHPVSWYYAREIDLIHEYQVDQAMSNKMDFFQYKKILVDLVLYTPELRLVNPISSNINKRLKMMNQKKISNPVLRYLGLSALLIIGSLSIHSCQKEESPEIINPDNSPTEKTSNSDGEPFTYESVDTFITFDFNTQEETVQIAKTESTVFKSPETMPMFPGCDETTQELLKECSDKKLLQFIYTNIKYPKAAREAGKEGTMVVQFIVGKDGKIYGLEFMKSVGSEFEDTIWDMYNKMQDKITWIPGMQNGKAVDVQYTLPIKFKLEG